MSHTIAAEHSIATDVAVVTSTGVRTLRITCDARHPVIRTAMDHGALRTCIQDVAADVSMTLEQGTSLDSLNGNGGATWFHAEEV